jgi:hypothetical protein
MAADNEEARKLAASLDADLRRRYLAEYHDVVTPHIERAFVYESLTLVESSLRLCHIQRMAQATYRIVPLSIIRYGVEVTEPDRAPRILLTCPTEAAANAWIAEIKRLSAVRLRLDQTAGPFH